MRVSRSTNNIRPTAEEFDRPASIMERSKKVCPNFVLFENCKDLGFLSHCASSRARRNAIAPTVPWTNRLLRRPRTLDNEIGGREKGVHRAEGGGVINRRNNDEQTVTACRRRLKIFLLGNKRQATKRQGVGKRSPPLPSLPTPDMPKRARSRPFDRRNEIIFQPLGRPLLPTVNSLLLSAFFFRTRARNTGISGVRR